jgi:cytochrome b561
MQLRNSSSRYGWVSIFMHWGVALVVFGLFALGLWMVGLDYYSTWRKDAPDLHKSIGLVLLWALVIFSGLHALAALKHHFIDRDATLTRMLGRKA